MVQLSRRGFLIGGVAVASTASVTYAVMADGGRLTMSPPEVLEATRKGDILFVDIRRPDEWKSTGVAEGAVPIDLRRDDFIDAVKAARKGNQPVALICARGVRSRRMTRRLTEAGLTLIVDVPEGMLGSHTGPGWLKRDLPIWEWTGDT